MRQEDSNPERDVFSRLRDFANGGQASRAGPVKTMTASRTSHGACELCSLPLPAMHRHLFEVRTKEVVCACDGCALTFHGVQNGRYRPVPRDVYLPDEAAVSGIAWDDLPMPINLAFFVIETRDENSATLGKGADHHQVNAYYPSPGGITRSDLPFDLLEEVIEEDDVFGALEPFVQALLVNRLTQKTEVFIAPIDLCYELTGIIRMNWKGFSGGEDVRSEMEAFFDRLRSEARPAGVIRANGWPHA